MFFVPLYIEILRSRPVLLFWVATLAQALIWIVVPMVFYAAPPGDLPQLLAIGHEFQLRGDVGPPLAYWLGEIAFRIALEPLEDAIFSVVVQSPGVSPQKTLSQFQRPTILSSDAAGATPSE